MERGRGWGCLAVGEVREQRAGKERVSEGGRKRIQRENARSGIRQRSGIGRFVGVRAGEGSGALGEDRVWRALVTQSFECC